MTPPPDHATEATVSAVLDIAVHAVEAWLEEGRPVQQAEVARAGLDELRRTRERASAPRAPISDRVRRAIELAAVGHAAQVQRSGQPYVLHPLKLMLDVAPLGEWHMVVAALHDYLEDCEVDEGALGFLTADERDALERLTHRDGDEYLTTYLDRILGSPLATAVKQADLRHNLDLSRRDLASPLTDRDLERCNKYRQALLRISEATA